MTKAASKNSTSKGKSILQEHQSYPYKRSGVPNWEANVGNRVHSGHFINTSFTAENVVHFFF